MKVRRPDHAEDHVKGDDQTSAVDVVHLDVIFCDDLQRPDDHVTTGKGETNSLLRRRMLVEQCPKRLDPAGSTFSRLIGSKHRPSCLGEPDLGDLTRPFDGGEVLAGGDDSSAEAVPAELNRDPVTAIDELFGLVGEGESATPLQFGETLVLGGLFGPFPPRALPQLGGEARIGIWSVFHGFSRSRHSLADTR